MNSSVIGKIEKAKRYAEERDRVSFDSFSATVKGEHDSHLVEYRDGNLACSCLFFTGHGLCSHSMAMQRILEDMLPAEPVPQA